MTAIYVDIDGTLTSDPAKAGGEPVERRIDAVRELAKTNDVVLWSSRGKTYAQAFAARHHLKVEAMAKPDVVVDDNPSIRPGWKVEPPEWLE